MPHELKRLVIVTHVRHYRHEGKIYAYAPYAREVDVWGGLFPHVLIAAPEGKGLPPPDCSPLASRNIAIVPQREVGRSGLLRRVAQCLEMPLVLWALHKAMYQADAVHVRCPGDLGLLGAMMAPLYCRYMVAKYAGQWSDFPGEAWTARLQKRILASRWWKGPTVVYGQHANLPSHVIPLFTSMLDEDQIAYALQAVRARVPGGPPKVLFVGRLSGPKNARVLLEAVAKLKSEGLTLHADIIGEGPERTALDAMRTQLGLEAEVALCGGLAFDEVLEKYACSDALVLVSETEGWPKVIAEAMAFGLICIASDRGFVREMLSGGRGILVPPGDAGAVADALRGIALRPADYAAMRIQASEWSRHYSLERLRDALSGILSEQWHCALTSPK